MLDEEGYSLSIWNIMCSKEDSSYLHDIKKNWIFDSLVSTTSMKPDYTVPFILHMGMVLRYKIV